MRLPTPLSRTKSNVHKNTFGHVLILAGSRQMLGAAALTALSALRSGAGLVSVGVPKSLNIALQKKLVPEIMTLPLTETNQQTLSSMALKQILTLLPKYAAMAIGPGLSTQPSTARLIRNLVAQADIPMVIDADAFAALSKHTALIRKTSASRILTPHPLELAQLIEMDKDTLLKQHRTLTMTLAKKWQCTLLLKGHQTLVASNEGGMYTNKTGNAGMATAGSGDVLTGMITAFLGQGMEDFKAAKYGAYYHGLAGDLAAADKTKVAMIASDIIEHIPAAFKKSGNI